MERFWRAVDELGIPRNVLEGFEIEESSKGWRVYSPSIDKMPKTTNDSYGILAIRKNGKPTSFFLRLFHRFVKKRVSVNEKELEKLLYNGEIEKKADPGWILVCFKGIPIGCGLSKNGKILLEMPKDDIMRARSGLSNLLSFKRR